MFTLIGFAGSVLMDGLILEQGADRVRILVSGMADTLEIRRDGENWFTEEGENVEFHFLATASKLPRAVPSHAAGRGRAGCA